MNGDTAGKILGSEPAHRTCVLVMGMHRSGTSALSRVLNLLGCDLPRTLMGPGIGNPNGHWESQAICALNDALLRSAGSSWHDWSAFDRSWYASSNALEFTNLAAALLADEFGVSSLFILKDPRICRIAPFWIDVIEQADIDPAIILPIRSPREVAASLERRDGFTPALAHLLWLRHVLEAEAATRGRCRLYTSYDDLLGGWQHIAVRAAKQFKLVWPRLNRSTTDAVELFLKEEDRHHRDTVEEVMEDFTLAEWVRETYAIVARWSEHDEDERDYPKLDRIHKEFDVATPIFAPLLGLGLEVTGRTFGGSRSFPSDREQTAGIGMGMGESHNLTNASAETAATQAPVELAEAFKAEIAELAAERDRLAEAGEKARGELVQAQDRVSSLESSLAQRQEEIAQAYAEIAVGKRRAEAFKAEIAELAAERDRLAEAGEKARGELVQAQDRVSSLESSLAQRQEEIAQAYAEIAGHKELAEAFKAEIAEAREREEAIKRKQADADKWVFRLSSERKALETQVARLERNLHASEAQRSQAEATYKRNLSSASIRLDQAIEEKHALELCLQERSEEIATLSSILRDQEAKAIEERQALELCLQERSEEIATLNSILRDQEAQAIEEKHALELCVQERFQEIATLSSILRDQEAQANRSSEEANWLREVGSIMINQKSTIRQLLLSFLPATFQAMRQRKLLKRKGLFDGDAYLKANPDVAADGADPLLHYLIHGITENRRKT